MNNIYCLVHNLACSCSDVHRYDCLFFWMTDSWRQCLCAQNALPYMRYYCLTGCPSVTGSWTEHVTMVGWVTTCVLPLSSCHSHVKGLFLSCCAALVATASVKWTASVRVHTRAVSDHSGKFPHFVHYICLVYCQEIIILLWFQHQFLQHCVSNGSRGLWLVIIWDRHLVVWCMSTNVSVNLPTPSSLPSTLQNDNRVSIQWWKLFQNTQNITYGQNKKCFFRTGNEH